MLILFCANVLQDFMPIVQDINPDLHVIDRMLRNSKSQEDECFPYATCYKLSSLALISKEKRRQEERDEYMH